MAAINLSEKDFEKEVLQADVPVLVDFWAEWCGPCKMMGPIVEKVSEQAQDVKVCKVNTNESMNLVRKYRVMQIPTLMLFKNGEVVDTSIGVMTFDEIMEFINK